MRVPFAQAIAGLLLGSCPTALPALAAEPVWGADLDCAACHINEAVPADNATTSKANETASSTATGTKTEAQVESKADAQAKEEVEGEDEGKTAQHLITIHAPPGCTTCHDDAKPPELHDDATLVACTEFTRQTAQLPVPCARRSARQRDSAARRPRRLYRPRPLPEAPRSELAPWAAPQFASPQGRSTC